VVDIRVGAGKEEALVAVVTPANQERWATVFTVDPNDLAIPIGLTGPMAADDKTVANARGQHE
jgi:hypothetical protein